MSEEQLFDSNPQWVEDEPNIRLMHGKRLKIKKGNDSEIVLLEVLETDAQGNRRPGFVIVACRPIIENDPYADARLQRLMSKP